MKRMGRLLMLWIALLGLPLLMSMRLGSTSQMSGRPFPNHLVVFTDNTVAQAKNSESCVFLSYLVGKHLFRTANLLMLTEGHTHEDIGSSCS